MNIIDAIKSGKPFRRKNDGYWTNGSDCRFYANEIIAEDWEIQEPTVTITRTQFLEAYGLTMTNPPWDKQVMDSAFAIQLSLNLGLGGE